MRFDEDGPVIEFPPELPADQVAAIRARIAARVAAWHERMSHNTRNIRAFWVHDEPTVEAPNNYTLYFWDEGPKDAPPVA